MQTRALGLIDLQEAEELRRGDAKDLTIQTEARPWHLRAESTAVQEAWLKNPRRVCGEEVELVAQLGAPLQLATRRPGRDEHHPAAGAGSGHALTIATATASTASSRVTDRAQVAKGLKMVSSSRLGMKGGASKAEAATNAQRRAARRRRRRLEGPTSTRRSACGCSARPAGSAS